MSEDRGLSYDVIIYKFNYLSNNAPGGSYDSFPTVSFRPQHRAQNITGRKVPGSSVSGDRCSMCRPAPRKSVSS